MAISCIWFELASEIRQYLKDNGFTDEFVTVEPDLVNNSVTKPVIIIDWLGNSGMDIDDNELRADRDKVVTLNIFIQSYSSSLELNNQVSQERLYNIQNRFLVAIHDWNQAQDAVTYPFSKKTHWGDYTMTPVELETQDGGKRKGTGIVINFHYKGV